MTVVLLVVLAWVLVAAVTAGLFCLLLMGAQRIEAAVRAKRSATAGPQPRIDSESYLAL